MSKEKKISIRHFDNKQLKTININNENVYQLYFQITYERKNFNYKCSLVDDFLKTVIEFPSESWEYFKVANWDSLKKDIITHNTKVIGLIIDKIKNEESEFKFDLFKEYYEVYSKNIFKYIDHYFLEIVIAFLKEKNTIMCYSL